MSYVDDLTVIMSEVDHLQRVGNDIKSREVVVGAKVNYVKLVDLHLKRQISTMFLGVGQRVQLRCLVSDSDQIFR